MNFNPAFFWDAVDGALEGLSVTLIMAFVTLLISLFFGTIIALIRVFRVKLLSQVFTFLVAVIKSIPANLIIIIVNLLYTSYFNQLMEYLHIDLQVKDVSKLWIGVFAMSICSIAIISESIRGALLSVPIEQYEAGYSVGMTRTQTFLRIIAPQALVTLLPNLVSNVIGLLKMTSLTMLVGVPDMLNNAVIRASMSFGFLEAYFAVSIFYWVMSAALEFLGRYLEKHTGRYKHATV